MTATPIPRSLAWAIYGELDVSILDEKPPGRSPVSTGVREEASRERIYRFAAERVAAGERVYVVVPAIDEGDRDVAATSETAARVAALAPGIRIGVLHGRLPPPERERVLRDFAAGRVGILVSTTVVEVGVDVPEATFMVVENAESFGLAQLHQLRGRVGRSSRRSWCALVVGRGATEEARQRLRVLEKTSDGFVIAEKDLETRGPGDLLGTRQSGLSDSTQLELEEAINGALKRASNPALAAASAPPAPAPEATVSRPGPPGGENPATGGPPAMPLSGIEAGTVSGNIYKNDALGLSCTLPKNWISAKPESLHALNERAEAAALQQHPELAGSGSVRFSIPKTVLYASLRGEGDGQRIALPSLRISAIPSRRDLLDPNFFSQQTQRVAASSGMKAVGPASQFTVNDHQFLRADFERTSGPSRICYSYVQTLARDYLLVIELFASSPEELQQIAAFLQSVSITGDVP